jgi:hypothetical protein
MSLPGLPVLLADLADDVGDVEVRSAAGMTDYLRAGAPFASVAADVVEIRLGAEIGEAAMRTPDTGPSKRGSDWVRFAPPVWDKLATDRLEAWFRVAWRFAEKGTTR